MIYIQMLFGLNILSCIVLLCVLLFTHTCIYIALALPMLSLAQSYELRLLTQIFNSIQTNI